MNINPFAVQAPDSVEHTLSHANATCIRFNHGKGLFVGHYVAAGRMDGTIVIISTETKGVVRYLDGGHIRSITSVNWSKFNRYLCSSSLDWNVIVWDLQDCSRLFTLRFDAPVLSVKFSPVDSRILIVILQTQQAILVNLRRGKKPNSDGDAESNGQPNVSRPEIVEVRTELGIETGDAGTILSATFSIDGEAIILGTSKGDLITFHTHTKTFLNRISAGSSGIREVAIDRSGRTLVTNSNDRAVRLFGYSSFVENVKDESGDATQIPMLQVTITFLHKFQDLINRTPWSGIGFSGDGEYVFGGATHKAAHNIYIWDRGAGVLDKILQGPRDSLVNVDWHPNRPMLASVSHTGAINFWFNTPTEIWSAYAPGFEELEENVIYEEREDEFDLEDEEEMTRRKEDEEEAHVDILLSLRYKYNGRKRNLINRNKMEIDEGNDLEEEFDDEMDPDDDETFAIPVRISLDMPDLEVDQD